MSETRIAKLTCEQRDQLLGGASFNKEYSVWSGWTDLTGELGEPRVETLWGPKHTDNAHPALGIRDIRHPGLEGALDLVPCEHWIVLIDW